MNFLNETLAELRLLIADDLECVENFMLGYLATADPFVLEVASYLMQAGGKRVRAVLALVFCKIVGLTQVNMLLSTSSLELIHNATLLHDDVVDECNFRRGIKSVNNVWGNKGSILVGDALLAMSFKIATEIQNIKFLSALSSLASELVAGEIMELNQNIEDLSNKTNYLKMIQHKTASLFAITCSSSSLVCDSDFVDTASDFGKNFGMAYQIIDDVLDYIGSDLSLGKASGSDFLSRKITLPVILSYQQASTTEKQSFEQWFLGEESLPLDDAIKIMKKFDAFNLSIKLAHEYIQKAIDVLTKESNKNPELITPLIGMCSSFFTISIDGQ